MRTIPEFPNYSITKDGRVWSHISNRWLKSNKNSHGYLFVILPKDGKSNYKQIHRLVLETYIGKCPHGMECCHANGNRTDNRLENLRWGTRSNNMLDASKHGTLFSVKLTEQDVRMIVYMYKAGLFTQKEIANIYDVDQTTVHLIVNKITWGNIWYV